MVTWNAQMKFREKIKHLLPFAPDILVIPECEAPEKWAKDGYINEVKQFLWFGDLPSKGIGILTMNPDFTLALHPAYNSKYRYIIPIQVSGKEEFILFAVWAQNIKQRFYSYIGQIYLALKHYEPLLKQKCCIIGDWNSHKIFDSIKRVGTHTDTVTFLEQFDIHSAYHSYYQLQQGEEQHPTHFFRKELESPFHIDYIFASKDLLNQLDDIKIGEHEKWLTHSDHMPIFTSFQE
jgi:exonuclease III